MPTNDQRDGLSPEHRQLLHDSAISDEVLDQGIAKSTPTGIKFTLPSVTGVTRTQLRPDKPRVGRDGKPKKYVGEKGKPNPITFVSSFEERVKDAKIPILIVEGTKQALAAASAVGNAIPVDTDDGHDDNLAVVGMAGCYGWSSGGKPTKDLAALEVANRAVTLFPDADVMTNPDVWRATSLLQKHLHDQGARVRIAVVPGGAKTGLDDYLATFSPEDRPEALRALVNDARKHIPRPTRTDGPRPEIPAENSVELLETLRHGVGLPPFDDLFRRGSQLVRVTSGENDPDNAKPEHGGRNSRHQVTRVTPTGLAAVIQERVMPTKTGKGLSTVPVLVSIAVTSRITENTDGSPNLRPLIGAIPHPFFRADGSLVSAVGYDESTGMFVLKWSGTIPIPEQPTEKQTADAAALLLHMLADFPFGSDDDRANYLAALLWPLLLKGVITEQTAPAVIINAHTPGSGKTLLASILRELFDGTQRSEWPTSKDEVEKELAAAFSVSTGSFLIFDNIKVLKSAVLEATLTSRHTAIRRLGTNDEMILIVNDMIFVFTGNNVATGGDLRRRVVYVTIDPRAPRPEERVDFEIPDLLGWVKANREQLIAALLTLVTSWQAAGRPMVATRSDGFAQALNMAQGILSHAGIAGTVGGGDSIPETGAPSEDDEWEAFCAAIEDKYGAAKFKPADLCKDINKLLSSSTLSGKPELEPERAKQQQIQEALPHDLVAKRDSTGKLSAPSLGRFLANRSGRYFGDRRIVQSRDPKAGSSYRIERYSKPPKVDSTEKVGGAGGARGARGATSGPTEISFPKVEDQVNTNTNIQRAESSSPSSPSSPPVSLWDAKYRAVVTGSPAADAPALAATWSNILGVLSASGPRWLSANAIRDELPDPPTRTKGLIAAARRAGVIEHRYVGQSLQVRMPAHESKGAVNAQS